MGYTTMFTGAFKLNRGLTPELVKYLKLFAATRHMKRDIEKLKAKYSTAELAKYSYSSIYGENAYKKYAQEKCINSNKRNSNDIDEDEIKSRIEIGDIVVNKHYENLGDQGEYFLDPALVDNYDPTQTNNNYLFSSSISRSSSSLNITAMLSDSTISNQNYPPRLIPGLWCQWIPSMLNENDEKDKDENGNEINEYRYIKWDGNEKFYEYVEWLDYIIENFLAPNDYILNGTVEFQGEDDYDHGIIEVKNNIVYVKNIDQYNI